MKAILLLLTLLSYKSYSQGHYNWERVFKSNAPSLICNSVCPIDVSLLILGGYNGSYTDHNFRLFDHSKIFASNIKYPGKGFSNDVFFCRDSILYVGGGMDSNDCRYSWNDFWRYDLKRRRWDRMDDLPFKYLGQPTIIQSNDSWWAVVPTYSKDFETISTYIFSYDLSRDEWKIESVCPDPDLFNSRSFRIRDELFIFFENSKYGNNYSGEFYKFSLVTKQWTKLKRFPGAQRITTFGITDGRYGFVGGGFDTDSYRDVYRYDPANDTWTRIKDLPETLHFANAWNIGNDIFVGFGKSSSTHSTYIWKLVKDE